MNRRLALFLFASIFFFAQGCVMREGKIDYNGPVQTFGFIGQSVMTGEDETTKVSIPGSIMANVNPISIVWCGTSAVLRIQYLGDSWTAWAPSPRDIKRREEFLLKKEKAETTASQ